jgi:hypothetical protein
MFHKNEESNIPIEDTGIKVPAIGTGNIITNPGVEKKFENKLRKKHRKFGKLRKGEEIHAQSPRISPMSK